MKPWLVFAFLLVIPTPVMAQLILPPSVPFTWNVGDSNSTAFHWNNFGLGGAYPGPMMPDQVSFHPAIPNASMTEITGSGFLTGGGNLYSQGVPMAFTATLPNYNHSTAPSGAWMTTVFVQTRTLGNEINYSGLTLGWSDGVGLQSLLASSAFYHQVLENAPLGGFGGVSTTHIWGFNVPYNPSQFSLNFAGAADSVSFDQVRVDTLATPVPEPGSLVLLCGAVLLRWCRRTKK